MKEAPEHSIKARFKALKAFLENGEVEVLYSVCPERAGSRRSRRTAFRLPLRLGVL